jgi:putative phosphoesterase
MKIGFISDVHANLPALDAVLDDLQNVDRIVHAGDIVGYNAFPRKVIECFQEQNIDSIAGNHDRAITDSDVFDFPRPALEVINWTTNKLTTENKEFINRLPTKLELEIDGYTILIVHGSPYETNEYIYPTDLTLELVEDLDEAIDVLIWGHTHYSIVTKLNDVLLLNPGSIGQPRDGDWRASYAIFDTRTGTVELRRKKYNIDRLVEKAKTESFPQQIIDSLRQPD